MVHAEVDALSSLELENWSFMFTEVGTLLPYLPKALNKWPFCCKSLWFHISVIFFFKMSITELLFYNKMHPLFDSWTGILKGQFWSFLMSIPVRMLLTSINQHQTAKKNFSSFCQFHHKAYPLLQDQPPKVRKDQTQFHVRQEYLHFIRLSLEAIIVV